MTGHTDLAQFNRYSYLIHQLIKGPLLKYIILIKNENKK